MPLETRITADFLVKPMKVLSHRKTHTCHIGKFAALANLTLIKRTESNHFQNLLTL